MSDPLNPPDPSAKAETAPFPIVGVGASAGGLEPVAAFLRSLPAGAGVAVVVVMHLDPNHTSGLAGILAKATPMPVSIAEEGVRVEPNQVYVIPPSADLFLAGGALHLEPRSLEAGRNLPIDLFLRSLAEDVGGRAVAVVLSGTGSDGALGVQAVRGVGGATFAQDHTAMHEGMPKAAVSTGCVDLVLPPEGIAREVVRIVTQPMPDEAQPPDDEPLLQRIFALLRASSGADFSSYKRSSFRRRVQRRVQITRKENLQTYVDFLQSNPAEVAALAEDVLIHVTRFFRDPGAFDALKRVVFARLVERRPSDAPIRVWVPACSSGEEVYSVVMCLLEFLADEGLSIPIKMFGTDISNAAIERARAGMYLANIAADVSRGRLQRFFVEVDGGYQIRRDVRDLCVFARHDVTRDPPFSDMDLISCRNLLIYLDSALQGRVLQVFHYALKSGGFLLLGAAETIPPLSGFSAADPKSRLFARTGPSSRPSHDVRLWSEYPAGVLRPNLQTLSHVDIHREADRAVLAQHGAAGVVVTEDRTIVQFRGESGPYVAPTPGAASLDLLRLARPDLRLTLRQVLDDAMRTGTITRAVAPRSTEGGRDRVVEVEVLPFRAAPSQQRLYAVLFRELSSQALSAGPEALPEDPDRVTEQQLRSDLVSTREYLQSVISQLEASNEELRAANEEVVSSNEELNSTNEELQLAKEELQASNEELSTVNGELLERAAEATRLNDDLVNLLASAAIPIVILGRDGRIRRFTPAAGKVLGLIVTDLGRPFTDLRPRLQAPDLAEVIATVQRTLVSQERAVLDENGVWQQLAVRPYVTVDNRVDGVTIALFNIDAIKRGEEGFRQMLASAAEPIVIVDPRGRVQFANVAAHEVFGYVVGEMVGLSLSALIPERFREIHAENHRRFMTKPAARPMGKGLELRALRKDRTEFPVEIGLAVMNTVDGPHGVAFINDISERHKADVSIREYQAKLQRATFDAQLAEAHERRRIAAELHDQIGQTLALVQIRLSTIRDGLEGPVRAELDECVRHVARSIEDARTLTFDLSPPILYDLGLNAALAWLADLFAERHGLEVAMEGVEVKGLHQDVAAVLFRVVRELLTNVVRHARVRRAAVTLRQDNGHVVVAVEDAGVGFDVNPRHADSRDHFGLFSVHEQISRLGGAVEITSSPGAGTRVVVRAPITLSALEPTGSKP